MRSKKSSDFRVIVFWSLGFGIMFGEELGGLIGTSKFFIDASEPAENTHFFFQVMFAATSITIVSGAVRATWCRRGSGRS